jgi:hypothetical protein
MAFSESLCADCASSTHILIFVIVLATDTMKALIGEKMDLCLCAEREQSIL